MLSGCELIRSTSLPRELDLKPSIRCSRWRREPYSPAPGVALHLVLHCVPGGRDRVRPRTCAEDDERVHFQQIPAEQDTQCMRRRAATSPMNSVNRSGANVCPFTPTGTRTSIFLPDVW